MYKTNPRKQEPVMGIGPGGSDLSQFFASQGVNRNYDGGAGGARTGAGGSLQTGSKPQTAGSVSRTIGMDPTEIGSNSKDSSKQISNLGPNITNIGFLPIYGSQTQTQVPALAA